MAKLQDETTGHSWAVTEQRMKDDFGEDWKEKIHIDPKKRPIGSGCIAQVYKGKILKPIGAEAAGKEVAVKVRERWKVKGEG